MKNFKRLLSVILAILIMASAIPSLAQQTAMPVFSRQFDSYVTNITPGDIDVLAKDFYIKEYAEYQKGLCLCVDKNGVAYKEVVEVSGAFCVSFDMITDDDAFSGYVAIEGNKSFKPITFEGRTQVKSDAKVCGLAKGKVNSFIIEIDKPRNKYNIYHNGKCVFANGYSANIPDNLSAVSFSFSSENTAEIVIDNVAVYKGEKREFNLPTEEYNPAKIERVISEEEVSGNTVFNYYDFENLDIPKIAHKDNHYERYNDNGRNCLKFERTIEGSAPYVAMAPQYLASTNPDKFVMGLSAKALKSGSSLVIEFDYTNMSTSYLIPGSMSAGGITIFSKKLTTSNLNMWYDIEMEFDVRNQKVDIYLDGIKMYDNLSVSFAVPNYDIRLGLNAGAYLIDDIRIYSGSKRELSEAELERQYGCIFPQYDEEEKLLKDRVGLHLKSSVCYVNGNKMKLDPGVIVENGRTLVSIRSIGELLGNSVEYDETSQTVCISGNIYVTVGSDIIKKDGEEIQIDVPAKIISDRVYVPLRAIGETLGKTVSYNDETYDGGMVVIGDGEFSFPANADKLESLNDFLFYLNPDADRVYDDYLNNGLSNVHPRLLVTRDKIEEIKQNAAKYDYIQKSIDSIIANADAYCNNPSVPKFITSDGLRLPTDTAKTCANVGFAYLLTGDKKYPEKAWPAIEAICSWETWNPIHELDAGETAFAIACAYDWMYDAFSPEQRSIIEYGLYKNGINQALTEYAGRNGAPMRWINQTDNFNGVITGGYSGAAIALMDVYPDECSELLSCTIRGIQPSIEALAPNGSFGEGFVYWGYYMSYVARLFKGVEVALGTDYGTGLTEGLDKTDEYIMDIQSPNGIYNFSDAAGSISASSSAQYPPDGIYWLSQKFGKNGVQKMVYEAQKNSPLEYFPLICAEPEWMFGESTISKSLDSEINAGGFIVYSSRESRSEQTAAAYMYIAGKFAPSHGHHDNGSFIYDANGVRWGVDLGADSYSLPEYFTANQFKIYRLSAQGHNCLVINPKSGGNDQPTDKESKIIRREENSNATINEIDMSEIYAENASSAKRGFFFTDYRRSLVVRDEVKLKKDSTLHWMLQTVAQSCDIDGNSATLTYNGKKLKVDILCNKDVQLYFEDAQPLAGTPVVENQNKNEGIKRFRIEVKSSDEVELTVKLTPENTAKTDVSEYHKDMSEWVLPAEDEAPEKVSLSAITIDGVEITNFNEDKYSYNVYYDADSEVIPEVDGVSDKFDVEVEESEISDDVVIINVKSREYEDMSISYDVKLIPSYLPKQHYEVKGVTVSGEPQATNNRYNAYDGDLSTRWSAEGDHHWIAYDLGDAKDINSFYLATYSGNARKLYFDVEVSTDGKNYTKIYEGETGGQTEDYEKYPVSSVKARFVRLNCYGTTAGKWNSISEFVLSSDK